MPHYRNGRTGRDRSVRVEPGASSSAWLACRQADHGRHRGALLVWECGAVASMIYRNWVGRVGARVRVRIIPRLWYGVAGPFVLTALHFSDADLFFLSLFGSKWKHLATLSYDLRCPQARNQGSNGRTVKTVTRCQRSSRQIGGPRVTRTALFHSQAMSHFRCYF
jgi:hypothetical protein